jgi:hypothetical protein
MPDQTPAFELRTSGIAGRGLVALAEIPPGHRLFRITGREREERYDGRFTMGARWYAVGPNRWICPHHTHPSVHLNHSCEPNVVWRDDRWVVALRRIRPGEELAVDYATTELDPFWRMECSCGCPRCRGIVLSGHAEKPPVRRRLVRLTPGFLRKHWDRMRRQYLPDQA